MAIRRPSSDGRSTRAIRAGISGRFHDSEESYGKVTHKGAPERQSLLERTSNPPRETSSVSETSISWRRGPGQRKRTGSLSCARRCSRRSVGITVSTGTARGNRNIIPPAGAGQREIRQRGRFWKYWQSLTSPVLVGLRREHCAAQWNVLAFGLEWAQLPVG